MINKYEHFTDDELYMLSRQAIESSYEIVESGSYSKEEILLHEKILNEIIEEQKRRKNEICEYYHEVVTHRYSAWQDKQIDKTVGTCWGTKEREECNCKGKKCNCDHKE